MLVRVRHLRGDVTFVSHAKIIPLILLGCAAAPSELAYIW